MLRIMESREINNTLAVLFFVTVFATLIATSEFPTIKAAMPVFRVFLQRNKKIIMESIAEYFYPLRWLKINIWNKLWIRKNKFHESLELDHKAMLHMTKKQVHKYLKDIGKRRQIAHERDLKKPEKGGEPNE